MRRGRFRVYRQPVRLDDWDEIARRFIKIVCSDPEIDGLIFCRLGPLFALPPPEVAGDYGHQTGNRIIRNVQPIRKGHQ